jgi:hypothetical protein
MLNEEDLQEIGKQVLADIKELPGYGQIIWHGQNQVLDGATKEWGIDIKTLDRNDPNHQYTPGRASAYPRVSEAKNYLASEMGLKGILGMLIIVDLKRDTAEIYVKEMPLTHHWYNGKIKQGAYGWRKYNAPKLLENIRIQNPLKSPNHPAPHL